MLAMLLLIGLQPALLGGSTVVVSGKPWRGFLSTRSILLQMCMSRSSEMVLRCVVAVGVLCCGIAWLYGCDPAIRPVGLVLVSGLAALGTYGCVHTAKEFRTERNELFAALPISAGRWTMTACCIPAAMLLFHILVLATVLVASGTSSLLVGAEAAISLATGILSLVVVYLYPENGIVIAAILLIAAIRIGGAIRP